MSGGTNRSAGAAAASEVNALARELYSTRHAYLLRIARRNSYNHADAEEALQDAFVIFVRSFDPDGEAPALAWLTLVLKRECWQRRKREHIDRRAGQEATLGDDEIGAVLESIPDAGKSPHEHAELRARVVEVRGQLAQLKPDERRALSLFGLGYRYADIIEITGWSHTKVNRCIAEGRARLRELRDEHG